MEKDNSKEIEIKKVMNALKERFWIVLLVTFIAGGAGFAYAEHTKPLPLYEASSTAIIQEERFNMETLKVLVTEPAVMDKVISEIRLDMSMEALRDKITVEDINSSQVIRFTAVESSPEKAVLLANTVAGVFPQAVEETLGFSNVNVLSEADINQPFHAINSPSNNLAYISIIFGLITSVGLVLLMDSLDNRIKSPKDVEILLEKPVLGSVPVAKKRIVVQKKEKNPASLKRGETIGQ